MKWSTTDLRGFEAQQPREAESIDFKVCESLRCCVVVRIDSGLRSKACVKTSV